MAKRNHGRERRAVAARYVRHDARIEVEFEDGVLFAFPAALAHGLHDAAPHDLDEVRLSPGGLALHWESLDVDLEISALLAGVFGPRTWMRELGRRGGQATSAAKARAARANGRKGGRPRKQP